MRRIFRRSRKIPAVRASAARPILRRRRDPWKFSPGRPIFGEIDTYLGAIGIDFAPHGLAADCVGSVVNPEESPLFADPPPGRFFIEGARFGVTISRSAEILRNLHIFGAIGRNFVPRGSVVDCVESPGVLKNLRGSRSRRPAGSAAKGRSSGKLSPDQPRYGEIATYLVRLARFRTAWISGRLCRIFRKPRKNSPGHGPAARLVLLDGGRFRGIPPGRPQ